MLGLNKSIKMAFEKIEGENKKTIENLNDDLKHQLAKKIKDGSYKKHRVSTYLSTPHIILLYSWMNFYGWNDESQGLKILVKKLEQGDALWK